MPNDIWQGWQDYTMKKGQSLQQIRLGKPDIYTQRNEPGTWLTSNVKASVSKNTISSEKASSEERMWWKWFKESPSVRHLGWFYILKSMME